MPGCIAGVVGWLIEDQRTVDQNITTQDVFYCVQEVIITHEAISPIEKQVQVIDSFQRAFTTVADDRLKRTAKKAYVLRRKHSNRKDNTIAIVLFELLL